MMQAVFTVFGQREERKKRFPPKRRASEKAGGQVSRYPGKDIRRAFIGLVGYFPHPLTLL